MSSAIRQSDYLERSDISDEDLQIIGGVVVTAPELTIMDLLRIGGTQRHQDRAYELLDRVNIDSLRQRFDAHSALPDIGTAQQLFESLVRQYQSIHRMVV